MHIFHMNSNLSYVEHIQITCTAYSYTFNLLVLPSELKHGSTNLYILKPLEVFFITTLVILVMNVLC